MKGAKTDAEWFSPVELAAAREEYLQEQEKEQPSPQVKLRYAIALAKSRKRDDKYRAIGLLEDLLEQNYSPKESLYWIALTLCGLGEYRASRSYCERLLRMEPSHMKAQLLHKRIKEVVAKEDGVASPVIDVDPLSPASNRAILYTELQWALTHGHFSLDRQNFTTSEDGDTGVCPTTGHKTISSHSRHNCLLSYRFRISICMSYVVNQ
ncbi:hypothetical protein PC128_g1510 [Phytophthora cactorum]|nr:hypothetical protein PC122_g5484 [Phytophthora cactorum]KAG3205301.1 hypothetical protein PC128_g1510 [Phytophthora cactorum]